MVRVPCLGEPGQGEEGYSLPAATKGASPFARHYLEAGTKVLPQGDRGLQSHQFGDALHRVVAGLQQLLAAPEPLCQQPFPDGEAGRLMKAAGEGAAAHQDPIGQTIQGMGLRQLSAQMIEQLVYPGILGGGGLRLLDELGLAPFPVGRDHQPSCQLVGDRTAMTLAYQIEAAVQPGGRAGRGDQPIVIHIEGVGIEQYTGEAADEILLILPVGRCPAPLEQPRIGEHIGTETEPHYLCASGVGHHQRIEQRLGGSLGRIAPEGKYEDVCLGQPCQAVSDLDTKALG